MYTQWSPGHEAAAIHSKSFRRPAAQPFGCLLAGLGIRLFCVVTTETRELAHTATLMSASLPRLSIQLLLQIRHFPCPSITKSIVVAVALWQCLTAEQENLSIVDM